MIKDVPFCHGHWDFFEQQDGHGVRCTDLMAYQTYGNTELQTLIETTHNRVIGFVGAMQIRPGVVEVWLLPSIHVQKFKKTFFKTVKVLIEEFARIMNLRRIQMTINSPDLWKWAEKLGFKFECRLKGYAPQGQTEYLFARCF